MKKTNLITNRSITNSYALSGLLFIVSCFIFIACTKSINNSNPPTDTTTYKAPDTIIYITGDNGTNPVLWKNGIADTLSLTTGTADQVTVSGNDVYVIGKYQVNQNLYLSNQSTGQYVYWKNGFPTDIAGPGMPVYNLILCSISVAGNNIYYTVGGKAWENESIKTFAGRGVGNTFASGTDVYFSGTDSMQDLVYWKNDSLHVVQRYFGYGSTPEGWCLYVSGDDVYIGGTFPEATYWKNDKITNLDQAERVLVVTSIFASGNDVYAAAYRDGLRNSNGSGFRKIPGYWKNGVEYDLPTDSLTDGRPTSIFVSGSDVYVAGYLETLTSTTVDFTAVYWKNGVETILSSPGVASSIYVAISQH